MRFLHNKKAQTTTWADILLMIGVIGAIMLGLVALGFGIFWLLEKIPAGQFGWIRTTVVVIIALIIVAIIFGIHMFSGGEVNTEITGNQFTIYKILKKIGL